MFSDNSYLCAILDRQGLSVAAPVDLRTKKAETKNPKQKEVIRQQYLVCLAVTENQILGGKHFLFFLGPESRKIWWLKKVQYFQKVSLPMDSLAWLETQVDFS